MKELQTDKPSQPTPPPINIGNFISLLHMVEQGNPDAIKALREAQQQSLDARGKGEPLKNIGET